MTTRLSKALVGFRVVLCATLLYLSVATAIAAAHGPADHAGRLHVLAIATVESLGALLVLLPRSRQAGGVLLLVSIGVALLLHLLRREFRGDLLVYLAGVILVMVHDRSTRQRAEAPPAA